MAGIRYGVKRLGVLNLKYNQTFLKLFILLLFSLKGQRQDDSVVDSLTLRQKKVTIVEVAGAFRAHTPSKNGVRKYRFNNKLVDPVFVEGESQVPAMLLKCLGKGFRSEANRTRLLRLDSRRLQLGADSKHGKKI